MASEQLVRNEDHALVLTREENDTLKGLEQVAQSELTDDLLIKTAQDSNDGGPVALAGAGAGFGLGLGDQLTAVAGAMSNKTNATLSQFQQHKWAGYYVKSPPQHIQVNNSGKFVETGKSKDGCKAAVVYEGYNNAKKPCAWLLAWHDARGSTRKVYVECGAKNKFNRIDWSKIERALEKAKSSASNDDRATKTKVTAQMTGSAGKVALTAAFSSY